MTWPVGFWAWFDLCTIAFFALFMLDKARLMYQRSSYRDRLGWSLIATDAAVGFAYLFGVFISLDPFRFFNSPEHKAVRIVVVTIIAWTWFVMRRSNPARIDKAVSGG